MTAERWQRIKAVFEAADGAPEADRAVILERECTGDADLRREVEALLAADVRDTFILGAIASEAASLDSPTSAGERFGHYKLIRRIGQGGQGAVYEAERIDDFHKKVALKIVRNELNSDFARTRFQQERQLLASLEHPYIARLLDGGESNDGVPYIVLEFVDGVPLTEFCATLERAATLRLFLKVCQAVEHAHRNLVIHRDLKPANILVTAAGDPKLLDFGIAKLLDPAATRTQTGMMALTPDYASPEQVRGLPISTASDVYALGVILYQLLTGRKPYTLDTATTFEMDRVICEQPPAAPGLGNELDHILLMALRKEPERRYGSVQQFAEDIERYLDKRPVSAQPDTRFYRARKYVQRHWIWLAAAAVAFTAICAGAGVAIYQANIARQRFTDVRQLANSFLFDFDDQIATLPGALKARQMLVSTALRYLDSLSRNAGRDVTLQAELARAYEKVGDVQGGGLASLGRYGEALASYRKSLAIYRKIAAADARYLLDAARVQVSCAYVYRTLGKDDSAVAEYRTAVSTLEEVTRKEPANMVAARTLGLTYGDLSSIYHSGFEDTAALGAMDKAISVAKAATDLRDPAHYALVMASRMVILQSITGDMGDFARAIEVSRETNGYLNQADSNDARAIQLRIGMEEELSQVYDTDYSPCLGDTESALEHVGKAEEAASKLLKDPNDANAKMLHALHLRRFSYLRGKASPETGIREGLESIRLFEELAKNGGEAIPEAEILASTRLLVADHYSRLSRPAEAREFLDAGLKSYRQLLEKTKGSILYRRGWLRSLSAGAATYRAMDDMPAALGANREAVALASELEPRTPRETALLFVVGNAYVEYGRYLVRAKQPESAREWFEKDAAIWRAFPNANQYIEMRRRQAEVNLAGLPVRGA